MNIMILPDRRITGWLILASIIVAVLYISFIAVQNTTEKNLQISILEHQILQQEAQTENLSSQIETDLHIITKNLEMISSTDSAKMSDFTSEPFLEQLRKTFHDLNTRTEISSLTILDDNGFVVNDIDESDEGTSIGLDLSFREYAIQTKNTKSSYFSNGFSSFLTGDQAIVITFPIIDDSNIYRGLVLAYLPTTTFFAHYAGITSIDSQSIIISDRMGKIIFHPDDEFIGQDISLIKNDESKISMPLISTNLTEIFTTSTITFDTVPTYYVHVFTSTNQIFSEATSILNFQKIILLILVTIILIILGLLITFIRKFYSAEQSRFAVIGEMGARLAHDIRNPLSIIKNTLEIMKMKKAIDDNHYYEKIDRAIFRITHQIDSVLDFLKDGQITKNPHKFSTILENVLDDLILPKNITLTKPNSDISIICDLNSFEAVLSNILLNSVQAMGNSGEIIISLSESKTSTKIMIQDSGSGINKETLPHIFEPLYTTKQSGTGLGLVSCKRIIDKHDGSLDVAINPTVFTISLPKW